MDVSALNAATANTSSAAKSATENTVSKDEFLLLFVTQLKNQDPLAPMDSTGFTAQLAQFSSLEQLTAINEGMESMVSYQASLQNAYAANMIGKHVGYAGQSAVDGTVTMQYGTVTGVAFDPDATYLIVDGATKIAFGDVKVIQ
ncbi:MAG: flgD [Deltaproteobacteria bacterium]|nr:flgD [Deltaproteobacteria bacterium]